MAGHLLQSAYNPPCEMPRCLSQHVSNTLPDLHASCRPLGPARCADWLAALLAFHLCTPQPGSTSPRTPAPLAGSSTGSSALEPGGHCSSCCCSCAVGQQGQAAGRESCPQVCGVGAMRGVGVGWVCRVVRSAPACKYGTSCPPLIVLGVSSCAKTHSIAMHVLVDAGLLTSSSMRPQYLHSKPNRQQARLRLLPSTGSCRTSACQLSTSSSPPDQALQHNSSSSRGVGPCLSWCLACRASRLPWRLGQQHRGQRSSNWRLRCATAMVNVNSRAHSHVPGWTAM